MPRQGERLRIAMLQDLNLGWHVGCREQTPRWRDPCEKFFRDSHLMHL